jgi:WD40 repeat protein
LLIVGDEKGKITLLYDYLNQGKSKKNKIQSVLEWHTGPILALCSNGQYIYSAGEESTVVLWHVRDLSRDFLPRVRLAIKYL